MSANPQIPCLECKKLIRKSNMSRHLKLHSERWQCQHCPSLFTTREKLSVHVVKSHNKADTGYHSSEKFHCDICTDSFTTFYRLSRHKREKHAKRRRINEYDVDLSHFNNHPTLIEELQSVRHFLRDDKVELNQKI